MAEDRRPIEGIAKTLELTKLALFLNLRALALTDDEDQRKELQSITSSTPETALIYFQHCYEWDVAEQEAIDAAPEDSKPGIVKTLLRRTYNHTPFALMSEG